MDAPEHLKTFRLIGRTTAFRAVRVYEHPTLGIECIEGHTIDGRARQVHARIVDVKGLGGTYEAPNHEDCGKRFNMHAGCVECCTCADCGLDRAYRLRRAELDSELQALGATVIRVEDLGAAMEARHQGGRDIHRISMSRLMSPFTDIELDGLARNLSRHVKATAHLARLALGTTTTIYKPT